MTTLCVDKAKLVAELQSRYSDDYTAQWRKFLSSAQVTRYGGVKDAAAKLAVLSGNQSPLLALFSVASQNTSVALPDVMKTFQPVQLITPPAIIDRLIGERTERTSTRCSHSSRHSIRRRTAGPTAEQAAQAANNATAARTAARQIAAAFNIDQQGQVNTPVQNLMEAPIAYAERMLKNFGSAEINVRSRAFCAQARTLLAKFPFSSNAAEDAQLGDVATMLRPGSGTLWRLYDDALAATISRQDNSFAPRPGTGVTFNAGFLTLLNRAAAFADAMFRDNSPDPHISFTVTPVASETFPRVVATLDGGDGRVARQRQCADRPYRVARRNPLGVGIGRIRSYSGVRLESRPRSVPGYVGRVPAFQRRRRVGRNAARIPCFLGVGHTTPHSSRDHRHRDGGARAWRTDRDAHGSKTGILRWLRLLRKRSSIASRSVGRYD